MTRVDGQLDGCIDITDENGIVVGALCKDNTGPYFVSSEDKNTIVDKEKLEMAIKKYNIPEEEMKKIKEFMD